MKKIPLRLTSYVWFHAPGYEIMAAWLQPD